MSRFALLALALCPLASHGLTIELRYDLDPTGFFNQPGAKEALRAAADFYEDLISDQLGAIDYRQFAAGSTWKPTYIPPGGSVEVAIPGQTNLIVPANTLIVFVGSANLGAVAGRGGPGGVTGLPAEAAGSGFPWANRVFNRGEAGAVQVTNAGTTTTNPTDFAPWGGTLFFNSSINNWNFSITNPVSGAQPDALSIALHEIGHILGIGAFIAQNSWTTLSKTGTFTGPLATQSYGSGIATNGVHLFPFGGTSKVFGTFGRTHGNADTPLMVETLPNVDRFLVPTDLEIAILQDMGWEITPPQAQAAVTYSAAAGPQLRIPSTTGFRYKVERSTTLASGSWADVTPTPLVGNGTRLTWTDTATANAAFYRVSRTPAAVATASPAAAAADASGHHDDESELIQPPDLLPGSCDCGGH